MLSPIGAMFDGVDSSFGDQEDFVGFVTEFASLMSVFLLRT